jgi:hypothetical protein
LKFGRAELGAMMQASLQPYHTPRKRRKHAELQVLVTTSRLPIAHLKVVFLEFLAFL